MDDSTKATFDPRDHLEALRGRGGASYLPVRWRLVWLRSEHPDASIATEHVEVTLKRAIFKATVAIPGKGSATGYGSETATDFVDFVEKAETKAVGRALIALGYGTEFATEIDDDAPPKRPDGLIEQSHQYAERLRTEAERLERTPPRPPKPSADDPATDQQIKLAIGVARQKGLSEAALRERVDHHLGEATIELPVNGPIRDRLERLTKRQITELTNALRALPLATGGAS